MWQLLMVDGKMRAEARAVLFLQKNITFYFPSGSTFAEFAKLYALSITSFVLIPRLVRFSWRN